MAFRPFQNRSDAGKQLAARLLAQRTEPDLIVLGLPRGGVPVAFEVAEVLRAPLDVFIVRKLGVPTHPELAMGAIASGGYCYIDNEIVSGFHLSERDVDQVIAHETDELMRRETLYRHGRPPLDLKGRTVILVDDGLATGSSMLAAIQAVRQQEPLKLVVAVPVAAASSVNKVACEVDDFVYVDAPERFHAVGQWYETFDQTSDDEVEALLSVTDRAQKTAANGG